MILCHDIHPGTIEAIPRIVAELKKMGYTFHTASELVEMTAPKPAQGKRSLRGTVNQ